MQCFGNIWQQPCCEILLSSTSSEGLLLVDSYPEGFIWDYRLDYTRTAVKHFSLVPKWVDWPLQPGCWKGPGRGVGVGQPSCGGWDGICRASFLTLDVPKACGRLSQALRFAHHTHFLNGFLARSSQNCPLGMGGCRENQPSEQQHLWTSYSHPGYCGKRVPWANALVNDHHLARGLSSSRPLWIWHGVKVGPCVAPLTCWCLCLSPSCRAIDVVTYYIRGEVY